MSDLQLKAWHIENLIEAEPDAQVVLLAEAQVAIRKVEQERDRLLDRVERFEQLAKAQLEAHSMSAVDYAAMRELELMMEESKS